MCSTLTPCVNVSRWGKDKSERVYQIRDRALQDLFKAQIARLHIIKIGGKLGGYHLGFEFGSAFYSWIESNHAQFRNASLGMLMKQYFIPKDIIQRGLTEINYMAGDYEYKKQMSDKFGSSEGIYTGIAAHGFAGRISGYQTNTPEIKGIKRQIKP